MGKKEKKKKQKIATKTKSSPKHKDDRAQSAKTSTVLTPTTENLTPFSADSDFERAWNLYEMSYTGWTKSVFALQSTILTTTLSWFEMCRKTLELDTELLKSTCSYWEGQWQDACTDSVANHIKAAISATTLQAGAVRDAQINTLKEYNQQWTRFFGL